MGSIFNAPRLRFPDQLTGFQSLRQGLFNIQKNIGIAGKVAGGLTQQNIDLAQRFGPIIQQLQSESIARDPLLGPFRQSLIDTLSEDVNLDRVRTQVRQSLGARGLNLRDPAGAISEAAALSTAGEDRRLNRLNVVGQFLGLGTQAPTPELIGAGTALQQFGFPAEQATLQKANLRLGIQQQNIAYQQEADKALGGLAVALGSAAVGGAAASAGGLPFLAGFGGSLTGFSPQSFVSGGSPGNTYNPYGPTLLGGLFG